MADSGSAPGEILIPELLYHPIILTAVLMAFISLVFIPVMVRFIITPIILFGISRRYRGKKVPLSEQWQESASRRLQEKLFKKIKKILLHSETFLLTEDVKTLLMEFIPPESRTNPAEEVLKTLKLNFSPVRLLETLLLAYEDLHNKVESRFFLRYLLTRKLKWYRPFQRSMKLQKVLNSIPVVDFINRRGLVAQLLRLVLIPLIGLPGLVLYTIRSILIRGVWSGLIRYYYTVFLFRASYYLIYLYGGNTENLSQRRRRFSRSEIIRKGNHFDRELQIVPQEEGHRELLLAMLERYEKILTGSGYEKDRIFSLSGDREKSKRHRLSDSLNGLLRRSLSVLNEHLSEETGKPGLRETALKLLKELPEERYPGRRAPWMNYRITQGLNVSYRLLMISLSRIYTNAPGSHFAMENLSVDLIRQAREFTRNPLINLLSKTGRNSYKVLKPVMRLRRFNQLRKKTTPAGVVSLSFPLFGKMIQDRWKEVILYRLGRAVIRYSIIEDHSLL